MTWSELAMHCQTTYGGYVDWDEEFFICPECEEPIYKCDFENDGQLAMGCCPVCEAELAQ